MWNVECGMWNVECGIWNSDRSTAKSRAARFSGFGSEFCLRCATTVATGNGHAHLKREGRDVKGGTVEAITIVGWHVSVAGSFWLVCREPHRGRHCQKRFSPAPRKCVNCMVRNILSRTQKWFSSNHRPVLQSPILSASSHWRNRQRPPTQSNSSKCVEVPKSQLY